MVLAVLAATVELILSELLTNAVQASEGLIGSRHFGRWTPGLPPVRLWLLSDRRRVVIRVWDSNPTRRRSFRTPNSTRRTVADCCWSRA